MTPDTQPAVRDPRELEDLVTLSLISLLNISILGHSALSIFFFTIVNTSYWHGWLARFYFSICTGIAKSEKNV